MGKVITNIYGLPQIIVDAVRNDRHPVAGSISVTELIKPPQLRFLRRKFEITEDVKDSIYSLLGTSVHAIIERADVIGSDIRSFNDTIAAIKRLAMGPEHEGPAVAYIESLREAYVQKWSASREYLTEFTMSAKFKVGDGSTVTLYGTGDLLQIAEEKYNDFKVTGSSQNIDAATNPAWRAQFSIYAWLYRRYGYKVTSGGSVCIWRDWNRNEARQNKPGYPKQQVSEIPIMLWSDEDTAAYIGDRVALHHAVDTGAIPVPDCTPEDKWQKAGEWMAIKKDDATKRKVNGSGCTSEEGALKFIERQKDPSLYLPHYRPAVRNMCDFYCPVRTVCPQKMREDREHNHVFAK